MAIYIVVSQPNPNEDKLSSAIEAVYPNDYLAIGNKTWLIASKDPIQDVSKKIGVADGTSGAAVIAVISAYHGRANPTIWNWIKAKWESYA